MLGHRASENQMRRDPMTFVAYSACKRCGIPLVREAGKWRVDEDVAMPAERARR
ncbi:MAG TPA: hypothetical protein VM308_03750 [Sphingomicrobium sp.]|nr:hypothetical protein [Sphingomicrobium sp.]